MPKINHIVQKQIYLPKKLSKFFWDYNFKLLSWKEDKNFIIKRILQVGDWESIQWLRKRAGDSTISSWIENHHGRGLDARRIRYWEVIFNINNRKVNTWINSSNTRIWENRTKR